MKLQLQIGGVIRKIKCNSTTDLQDLCMVLSHKTCRDYGFMSSFPPRNTGSAVPDRQGPSETANTENPTKVDDPPQDESMRQEFAAWFVMMKKFTSNIYKFAEEQEPHYAYTGLGPVDIQIMFENGEGLVHC